MCGIAGLFDLMDRRPVDAGILQRMTRALKHRGPDDEGYLTEPGIGLGHRRLSIIDLAGGHQPLFNETGTVSVIYNGEIYNYREVMSELAARGHRFRSRSDAEAVLHGWEEWGEACVERFRGMFAFAVWDGDKRALFLGRDRLGVKPLYWSVLPSGWLAFGSELKALLAHPSARPTLNLAAVEDYFAFGYVPDPKTIFTGFHKLAPGETLLVRQGERNPVARRYWTPDFPVDSTRSPEDLADELAERLREAVRLRLVSDVPVGAFLSGGVDSSAVVAMMAQESSEPVRAISIAFSDRTFDESDYARAVAQRYGCIHEVRTVEADSFDLVDRLAFLYDEPFADSSALPTYRVSEATRQFVKVALSGDGGDEVFAGYRRYRWHAYEETIRGRVPPAIRRPVFTTLGELYPKMDWAPRVLRAKTTLQAVARDSDDAYFHSVSVMPDNIRRGLFTPRFRAELAGYRAIDHLRRHFREAPSDDVIARLQYVDMMTYLPGDILTKVDRASMAHGLEVREPLLDHRLIEWAGAIPSALKLKGRQGKYIFKKALAPYLPRDLLERPKMGFGVPLARWLRGPLRPHIEALARSGQMLETGYFDPRSLGDLVARHVSGIADHSASLWSVLMFEAFLRQSVGGSIGAPAPALTGT